MSSPTFSTKVETLFSSAARTSSTNGTAVTTGTHTSPITQGTTGFSKSALVMLDVTLTAGTSPTLDFKIQGSNDNYTWIDLPALIGSASAVFTQATTVSNQSRRIEGPLPQYLRGVATIGGTTPSVTFSASIVLGG